MERETRVYSRFCICFLVVHKLWPFPSPLPYLSSLLVWSIYTSHITPGTHLVLVDHSDSYLQVRAVLVSARTLGNYFAESCRVSYDEKSAFQLTTEEGGNCAGVGEVGPGACVGAEMC